MRGLIVVLTGLMALACGAKADGPPEIEVDRTACSHCGMFISEPIYAAAYRAPGSDPRVFDDIKCLLEAAQREPRAEALRVWFHDAVSGDWIDGTGAVFVASPDLRTPMGGGLIAFRDPAAARDRAARSSGATIIGSIDELRKRGS